MATNNLEVGQRIQEKYEFYALSLTFTILALSIQTAQFEERMISDILELLAWIALFVSALSLLNRTATTGPFYYGVHQKEQLEREVIRIRQIVSSGGGLKLNSGETLTGDALAGALKNLESNTDGVVAVVEGAQKKSSMLYTIHTHSFWIGLLLLLIARGYEPAARILDELQNLTNGN